MGHNSPGVCAGIDPLDSQESEGLEEQISQAERDLRSIQTREERAITLFVSGRITERLENVRAKLDDYRAWVASGAEKVRLVEAVFAWARDVGQGPGRVDPRAAKRDPADGRGRGHRPQGRQRGHHAGCTH